MRISDWSSDVCSSDLGGLMDGSSQSKRLSLQSLRRRNVYPKLHQLQISRCLSPLEYPTAPPSRVEPSWMTSTLFLSLIIRQAEFNFPYGFFRNFEWKEIPWTLHRRST